jgi:hypothetical protein
MAVADATKCRLIFKRCSHASDATVTDVQVNLQSPHEQCHADQPLIQPYALAVPVDVGLSVSHRRPTRTHACWVAGCSKPLNRSVDQWKLLPVAVQPTLYVVITG